MRKRPYRAVILAWGGVVGIVGVLLVLQVGLDRWDSWQATLLQVLTVGLAPVVVFVAAVVGAITRLGDPAALVVAGALFFLIGLGEAAIVMALIRVTRRLIRR